MDRKDATAPAECDETDEAKSAQDAQRHPTSRPQDTTTASTNRAVLEHAIAAASTESARPRSFLLEPQVPSAETQVSPARVAVAAAAAAPTAPASLGYPVASIGAEANRWMGYQTIHALEANVDLPEYVKAHNATLTFPEKLMLMLTHVEREFSKPGKRIEQAPISWVLNGRAFVIRNKEKMTKTWLPLFFRQAKFSSFTRKLYRWGFRQVNMTPNVRQVTREIYFGNEHFQRDNKGLMVRMRSVTAQGIRREKEAASDSSENRYFSDSQFQESKQSADDQSRSESKECTGTSLTSLASLSATPIASLYGSLNQRDVAVSSPNAGAASSGASAPSAGVATHLPSLTNAQIQQLAAARLGLQPHDVALSQYLMMMGSFPRLPSAPTLAPPHPSRITSPPASADLPTLFQSPATANLPYAAMPTLVNPNPPHRPWQQPVVANTNENVQQRLQQQPRPLPPGGGQDLAQVLLQLLQPQHSQGLFQVQQQQPQAQPTQDVAMLPPELRLLLQRQFPAPAVAQPQTQLPILMPPRQPENQPQQQQAPQQQQQQEGSSSDAERLRSIFDLLLRTNPQPKPPPPPPS